MLDGSAATRRNAPAVLKLSFALLVAALLLNAAAAEMPADRAIYRNDEFGITVPAPDSTLLCPTPNDQHDHGPIFLLGTSDAKNCDDSEHSRSIVIFAGYNASDATKKLQDFLKWQCDGACLPAPTGLRIAGLPSAAARVNRPHGWIDITVVTQAGKADRAFDASVPLINYDLTLHTRALNLEEDLRTFRVVLRTVRLSPAQ